MPTRVRVIVPASTANLGPGFDCLGLALGIHNAFEFNVLEAGEGLQIEIGGEGKEKLKADTSNLAIQAANAVWESLGQSPLALKIKMMNNIPLGSGMGSSAAAIVGGLVAANALAGGSLTRTDLLRMATRIEGHPDNVAAAIFGGLTIVSHANEELMHTSLDVPPMKVAIALPNIKLSTADARAALPKQVPFSDAVFNMGRTAFVIQALQKGDYDLLSWAMTDKLHQPYRKKLIAGFDDVVNAARRVGARAVALSGAGPSIAAFAPDHHWEIAEAMKKAFEANGVACRTFVLPVDRQGVQISVSG